MIYISKTKGNVVATGDHKTEWISMTCGVPQGSIFGPLLFNWFSNKIQEERVHYFYYLIFACWSFTSLWGERIVLGGAALSWLAEGKWNRLSDHLKYCTNFGHIQMLMGELTWIPLPLIFFVFFYFLYLTWGDVLHQWNRIFVRLTLFEFFNPVLFF